MKFRWEPIWSALALGTTLVIGFSAGAARERQKIGEDRTIVQQSNGAGSANVIGGGNVTISCGEQDAEHGRP